MVWIALWPVVWRATWPNEKIVKTTLSGLEDVVSGEHQRTALIVVGRVLGTDDFDESCLYAGDYDRRYRPVGTDPRFPDEMPED